MGIKMFFKYTEMLR